MGNPGSATLRIRDDEWAPAPVIFSDNFESDTAANWIVRFGANNGIDDATRAFAYDYVTAGIPLAPHSAAGTSGGLFVAVNKSEPTLGGSAGINLYPAGQSALSEPSAQMRLDTLLQIDKTADPVFLRSYASSMIPTGCSAASVALSMTSQARIPTLT